MNVGIVGTGSVGTSLARGLAAADHDVVLGSREPDAGIDLGEQAEGIGLDSQRAAAEHGEVVVLAVPASAVLAVATGLSTALAGKTVVDPTNEYPEATADDSIAERLAETVPSATVVKAFNTIGAEHFLDPVVADEPATMFLAGPGGESRDDVEGLATDLGFETVVVGNLGSADRLEHLARLWIDLSRDHGREVAFRLLRE